MLSLFLMAMWYFTVGINDALNKLSIVSGHLYLLLFFVWGLNILCMHGSLCTLT